MLRNRGIDVRKEWRLGLGTYQLGVKTERVVSEALRLGYRHIDTAALYRNEGAVASAIKNSNVRRSEICLTTKIHIRDIDRLTIRKATEEALARLGEIDILLLHGWRPNAPEAWELLAEEAKAGRVRKIGVSNFGFEDISSLGSPAPFINQIELSPFLPRRSLRKACDDSGIMIAAHSPLAKARRFAEFRDVMGNYSAAQVMIAWALEGASVVLPRSSNSVHLGENLAALEIELSAFQRRELDAMVDGYATHRNALRR